MHLYQKVLFISLLSFSLLACSNSSESNKQEPPIDFVDLDNDGIDDAIDDSLNFKSNIHNGPLQSVESWVYSPDKKLAYIGSDNGLILNTLDEQGHFTDNSIILSAIDFGLEFEIAHTRQLEISSKGVLYWSGMIRSEEDHDSYGFIAQVTLDTNNIAQGEVSVTNQQFIELDEIGSGIFPSFSSVITLSPDESRLYARVRYSVDNNRIMTFDVHQQTGDITHLDTFDFELDGTESQYIKSGLAISSDGNYLYYSASTTDNEQPSQIVILPLNGAQKQPTSFSLQNNELTTNFENGTRLLISSYLNDKLLIASGAKVGVYEYAVTNGQLTQVSELNFSDPVDDTSYMGVSGDGTYIGLIRAQQDGLSKQLNIIKVDDDNQFTLVDTKLNIEGSPRHIEFINNTMLTIGVSNNAVYAYSLNDKSWQELNPFSSSYTELPKVVLQTDNQIAFVNNNHEFIRISVQGQSHDVTRTPMPLLEISYPESLVIFDDRFIQFSSNFSDKGFNCEYVVASQLQTSPITQKRHDLYTSVCMVYKAYRIGDYVVTLENSPNFEYLGIALYQFKDNKLEFVEASIPLEYSTYRPYFIRGGMQATTQGVLLNGDEYIVENQRLVINPQYTPVVENTVSLLDNSMTVRLTEGMLASYKVPDNNTVLSEVELPAFKLLYKIDQKRVLLVSDVFDNQFEFTVYQVTPEGKFETLVLGDYQVIAPNGTLVNAVISNSTNSAWLMVNGGMHHIGLIPLNASE